VAKYQVDQKKKIEQLPIVKKNKKLQNVKSRIDTGIRRINGNMLGSDEGSDSFEYNNQYNVGDYANEEYDLMQSQNYPQKADVRKFNFNQNHQHIVGGNKGKNQSNVDYEVFTSEEENNDNIERDEEYPPMHRHHVDKIQQEMYSQQQYNRPSDEIEEELGKEAINYF